MVQDRAHTPPSESGSEGLETWVVLLAGGLGSRFWPASTPLRPKQFLPLASAQPLIRDTYDRARAVVPDSRILIVAGAHLRNLIEECLPELRAEQLLIEPAPRGTAPALAWAAMTIEKLRKDRAVMIAMPADHVIRPLDAFTTTLGHAVDAAARLDELVTLGIRPTRPETAYGYIEIGEDTGGVARRASRFVEKPDLETAERYLASGSFLWNSGIFIWGTRTLLDELAAHTPEIAMHLELVEAGDVDGFFSAVPDGLTIDYGLMERSQNVAVVEAEFNWDDVGSWGAVLRLRETDESGNVIVGPVEAPDSEGCIIWADDGPIVAWGVNDLIIARASGVTFVAPIDRTADLKQLLERLPDELRRGGS